MENNKNDDAEATQQQSPIISVAIASTDFVAAVDRYMEETGSELDSLQKRQMKQWRLEWSPRIEPIETLPANLSPTHSLIGCLQWSGEYVTVVLEMDCYWRFSDDGKAAAGSESFLQATCTARICELTLDPTTDKKQAKIHSKVLKRLRKDDYISKLLLEEGSNTTLPTLLHAAIEVQGDGSFEERVDYTSDVAEAIRRAVYNTAAAPIDILDVVCRFPFLPGTEHQQLEHTTPLADRAILRLLEDATYDACEDEGDEEIRGLTNRLEGGRTRDKAAQNDIVRVIENEVNELKPSSGKTNFTSCYFQTGIGSYWSYSLVDRVNLHRKSLRSLRERLQIVEEVFSIRSGVSLVSKEGVCLRHLIVCELCRSVF